MAAIKSSAEAAIETCTGGENGRMCGMRWSLREFDGDVNLGQEMGVLSALMTMLVVADGGQTQGTSDAMSGIVVSDGHGTSDGAAGYAEPDGHNIKSPLTHDTGGTSVGDPQAGQSRRKKAVDLMPVDDVDTIMAIILTAMVMTCALVMFVWMATDDIRLRKVNISRPH